MATKSDWVRRIEAAVKTIPRGKTLSYGQLAMIAGRPGGARAAVKALHALEGVPWWRVIRSDGTLAEVVRAKQARRLAAEGVKVTRGRVPASARLTLGERSSVVAGSSLMVE